MFLTWPWKLASIMGLVPSNMLNHFNFRISLLKNYSLGFLVLAMFLSNSFGLQLAAWAEAMA